MRVLLRDRDLSEEYVRFASQIGCDGFDVMNPRNFPSVLENGFVDVGEMVALRRRLERWGLAIHCVMPPAPVRYLLGEREGAAEAENQCRTVEGLAKAGVKLVMIRAHLVELGSNPGRTHARGKGIHRGATPVLDLTWRRCGAKSRNVRRTASSTSTHTSSVRFSWSAGWSRLRPSSGLGSFCIRPIRRSLIRNGRRAAGRT